MSSGLVEQLLRGRLVSLDRRLEFKAFCSGDCKASLSERRCLRDMDWTFCRSRSCSAIEVMTELDDDDLRDDAQVAASVSRGAQAVRLRSPIIS
jgi:hypothetical protein